MNFACVSALRAETFPRAATGVQNLFYDVGSVLQKVRVFENLWLTKGRRCGIITNVAGNETPARHMEYAAVAHLVERHLAKVEVASSSLVGRSIIVEV